MRTVFFSDVNITKSRYRSRLKDENLNMQLRVASSSVHPNTQSLLKLQSFQISHLTKNLMKCIFLIFHTLILR